MHPNPSVRLPSDILQIRNRKKGGGDSAAKTQKVKEVNGGIRKKNAE